MDSKNKNFLKRFKLAIFNVEKYQDLALENFNVAIKYFFKLIFALTIVVAIAATIKFTLLANFFVDAFKTEFPDFVFSNSTLTAEQTVNTLKESNNMQLKIIVDTNTENTEEINNYIAQISDYENGVIFLKDKLILQIDGISGQTTYNYSDFNTEEWNEMTKQSVEDTINNVNVETVSIAFFISIALYMFMAYIMSTLVEVLLIAVIGYLTAKIVKLNMKFAQICSMAIYSITLSILLNAIYTPIRLFTGFNMEYFSVMYTLIPYIYIITAILMSRSELIKQQIEIGKIEKVQEEVKEEIKDRDEKKKEEKKEKDKDKNKEKKDKDDEEPEGSEA